MLLRRVENDGFLECFAVFLLSFTCCAWHNGMAPKKRRKRKDALLVHKKLIVLMVGEIGFLWRKIQPFLPSAVRTYASLIGWLSVVFEE